MMHSKVFIFAALFASTVVSGYGQNQNQNQTASPDQTVRAPVASPVYAPTIGIGDLVQINVFHTPDLSTQARVDPTGDITMPLAGVVHVAGLSPEQAGKQVSQTLSAKNLVDNLDVSVMVLESAAQRVSVLGEVKNPGSVPLTPHMHLLDVLSAAGGVLPSSSGVVSVAHLNGGSAAITYRISGQLSTNQNPEIEPGDTIQAEHAGIVYVVGAVNRAGGFLLENGKTVTMLQAIALAEGATNTAKLHDACLIHTQNGNRTTVKVDIKALLQNHAPDRSMEPDDILFIPNSQFKEILRGGAQGAMDMAAALSIYHI